MRLYQVTQISSQDALNYRQKDNKADDYGEDFRVPNSRRHAQDSASRRGVLRIFYRHDDNQNPDGRGDNHVPHRGNSLKEGADRFGEKNQRVDGPDQNRYGKHAENRKPSLDKVLAGLSSEIGIYILSRPDYYRTRFQALLINPES